MTRGIDLSKHNGTVDFDKLKKSGKVDYVILRAGYGKSIKQKDPMFEEYYAKAKAAGFPVGAYWYSYAMTEDEARLEADVFLEAIKGKQFEYPVYYDVEEDSQFKLGLSADAAKKKTLTASEIAIVRERVSAIIRAFLERVESHEYWVGLYGSYSSLTTFTAEDIRDRYAIWLAHWGVKKSPYKGQYGMWQYGVGKVSGIKGDVDLDECYEDYPTLIKNAGDNGFEKVVETPTPVETPAPVEEIPADPTPEKNPYTLPVRPVKEGQSGDDVKWLQFELKRLGYYASAIDGRFGVLTLGGVLAFQMKNGLEVDGVCGPMTRGTLQSK